MHGVLVVDKPSGPTSHDVVAQVRRHLKVDKVGHTGTLDPMATGVLPLVMGRATKLAQYLSGGAKSYRAHIALGTTTTTLDGEGEVTSTRPVAPEVVAANLEAALARFRGTFMQVPPMYSAKKVDGQKLYKLARRGIEIERQPKPVTIFRLVATELLGQNLHVEVCCSAGTYVRVLALDIGEALGCGAHLKALRRTAAGPFGLEQAVSLEAVLADSGLALARLLPLERALSGLGRIDLPAGVGAMVTRGYQLRVADLRVVDTPAFECDEALALGFEGGPVIAVARAQMSSEDLLAARRDRRALQIERVLGT